MLGLLGTIIIGFIAGLIARAIHPGDDKAGFLVTTALGIIGAFVANFIGRAIGWYGPNDAAGLIGSVVGAIIILVIYNFVRKRT